MSTIESFFPPEYEIAGANLLPLKQAPTTAHKNMYTILQQ